MVTVVRVGLGIGLGVILLPFRADIAYGHNKLNNQLLLIIISENSRGKISRMMGQGYRETRGRDYWKFTVLMTTSKTESSYQLLIK